MDETPREFNGLLLGMRIEKARHEQQLTRGQLASACNITTVHIRHLEDGSRLPSLPVFVMLCNALHVSPTYFLADFLDLKTGLPDAYTKVLETLSSITPRQAEIIAAMLESMSKILNNNEPSA